MCLLLLLLLLLLPLFSSFVDKKEQWCMVWAQCPRDVENVKTDNEVLVRTLIVDSYIVKAKMKTHVASFIFTVSTVRQSAVQDPKNNRKHHRKLSNHRITTIITHHTSSCHLSFASTVSAKCYSSQLLNWFRRFSSPEVFGILVLL